MITCPRCDYEGAFADIDAAGDGLLHDLTWCGDDAHCGMHITCPECDGAGVVEE